ncbi:MAG: cytochrome c3 family protein, partial [Phycisphaerae bacterium]
MGLLVLALGLGIPRLWASERESDEGQELLRSDSGSPYVHRITLYDHQGEVIDPEDESAGPYSPRMTCAKCHPYAQISGGWHFNAPNEAVPAGRPGERWLLVDPLTGTQLPISGRKWPGTFTPEDVGLTNWEFVKTFGRHIPGGGYGEPDDEDVQNSPESVRWSISGRLEIDCMFCHAADQQHDPAEAARQIEKENFKWAATAALGLAVVRGEARKAPDDWDPLMEPDPDFPERAGPRLVWNTSRFDADNRVLFEITRRPSADRCYFCHSFREVGAEATAGVVASQDVHLAAGLTCVDCHRNELDHMMARGYGNEADERGEPELAVFSCEGCHLGVGSDADAKAPLGGRYGAPHP